MFGWIDPMYLIYVGLPGLLLGLYAQWKVKSAFARGSQIASERGWTGQQVAQRILDANGIYDVSIEPVEGYLSDHYDPRHKVLRLSPDVYHGRSLAAAGVAAHEVGHAIQHARGYAPLAIRNSVVPIASFGSGFGMTLAFLGIGMGFTSMAAVGVALFTMVVIFQVVNLPVEFNASTRARQTLVASGLVSVAEDREVGRVLSAAAMTYVAATISAILTLVYLLIRSGLLGGAGRDQD
ncbi:MAG: zinc metallopeptidase [Phycisphaerae bacterium]|nr:zinc metallopeptidase [Phycisphaerae bacterium]